MKRLPKTSFPAGFTLVEILVASAAAAMLLAGVYVLSSTVGILAAKSFAINSTGSEARNALDLIQNTVQQSFYNPVALDGSGNPLPTLSSTSTPVELTGMVAVNTGFVPITGGTDGTINLISGTMAGTQYIPAKGIAFYRIIGQPYIIVTNTTTGVPFNSTSLKFRIGSNAQIPPPLPQPNDIISIYTTAIVQTGSVSSDNTALVQVTGSATTSLTPTPPTGVSQYTVNISGTFLHADGMTPYPSTGSIAAMSGLKATVPAAVLLRPTAFVIVNASTAPQLRYIASYTTSGTNANGWIVNVNGTGPGYYRVLTSNIQPFSDANPRTQFSWSDPNPSVSLNGQEFVSAVVHIRNQNYDAYLNYGNRQRTDFSTFMGIGTMISLKSSTEISQ